MSDIQVLNPYIIYINELLTKKGRLLVMRSCGSIDLKTESIFIISFDKINTSLNSHASILNFF